MPRLALTGGAYQARSVIASAPWHSVAQIVMMPIMTGAPRHLMTGHPIHNKWKGMLTRCLNPNYAGYKNYGGRGITICDRWLVFENFYADMGPTFREGLTLDRVDVDGPYEPANCRWVPRSEQNSNRRSPRKWAFKKGGIATNTSGIRGVSPNRKYGGWSAAICIAGKQRNLGRFETKAEAALAYRAAAKERR